MQKVICFTAIVVCLISIAVGAMPEPYYSDVPARMESPEAIAAIISEINYSPMYVADVFDCSEIAAHVEWRLENMGIDTKLALTAKPDIPHMFVTCNTTKGWVVIETCYDDGVAEPIYDTSDWHYNHTTYDSLLEIHELDGPDKPKYGAWWNTIEP